MLDNIVFGIAKLARSGVQAISNTIEVGVNIVTAISNVVNSSNYDSKENVQEDEEWEVVSLGAVAEKEGS